MTGAEALRAATRRLEAAGIEGAARDARWLLAFALGLPRDRLVAVLTEPLLAKAEAGFEAAVTARLARQPVSQITGRREFWGREFKVTPEVLDPRPETELLVELALGAPFGTVLDLGTGSGAILLSLLAERVEACGIGSDISGAALAVAKENAAALGLGDRATFVRADWYEGIDGRFDLIVSNPPYIALAEMPSLASEVRDWEPQGALTDGQDGLRAYPIIAAGAAAHMTLGGRVIVEIGATQSAAVIEIFRNAGLEDVSSHTDLSGRQRAVFSRNS